tara:strand:+ start:889 stop:2166 length:1278 start_codon:yes stop_codon:yes gene_type:complete
MTKSLGNHILVEFMNCSPEIMNDASAIEQNMVGAAKLAGATVVNSTFHHFSPYGVSGVVVIEESHFAIHTWPEYGYAAVDLFTCGEINAWLSFDNLKECFGAQSYSAIEMKRGSLNLLKRNNFKIPNTSRIKDNHNNLNVYARNVWFTDKDENQALSLRFTGEVFHDTQSPFQRVRILKSYKYGKMLALDDMVMTTEKDEFHYHEMISHPSVFIHGNVKNVLVIGGGDGGTVRELLRHEEIKKITMVEIDNEVINACKKHLPLIASEFNNPRLNLIIDDGIKFVKLAKKETYDLIIVDGSDPVGPAEGLFTKEFYENCYNALSKKGILVAQGESPKFNENAFIVLNKTLNNIFGSNNTAISLFYAPTYPTGMWSFQYGFKGNVDSISLSKKGQIETFVSKHKLSYYNYEIHLSSFVLPNFIKNKI